MTIFPIMRIYPFDENVDEFLKEVARRIENEEYRDVLDEERHYAVVKFEESTVWWWKSNKFYAYASDGKMVKSRITSLEWKHKMPGRSTAKRLHKAYSKAFKKKIQKMDF